VIAANVIEVLGDSEFLSAGFTGGGTPGDPYILDGADIEIPSGDTGIYVSGTTAHFIIRNCIINPTNYWDTGIHLLNLSNGTIENCEVIGNPISSNEGILVQNCNNVNITGNFVNETFIGIQLENTPFVNVLNNTLTYVGRRGIAESSSPNATISENTVIGVAVGTGSIGNAGIITSSSNQTISENEIRIVNAGSGIEAEWGQDVKIENNLIRDVGSGVWISHSVSTIIIHNNISCAVRGLAVSETTKVFTTQQVEMEQSSSMTFSSVKLEY